MHQIITSWTYQNGELLKDKLKSISIVIALMLGALATFLIYKFTPFSSPDKYSLTKMNGWIFMAILIGTILVFYFLLNLSANILLKIYHLLFVIRKQ